MLISREINEGERSLALWGLSIWRKIHTHTSCPWLVLSFWQRHPIYYSQITKHGIGGCVLYAVEALPIFGHAKRDYNTSSPHKEGAWWGPWAGTSIPNSTAPLEILAWLQLAQEEGWALVLMWLLSLTWLLLAWLSLHWTTQWRWYIQSAWPSGCLQSAE